jgi:CheY-like chemotaxis protein
MHTALILVIDDDEDVRVTLGQDLLDAGHLPLFATDAVDAVERTRIEQPDLVILDVRFPGGGGLDVLQRLKRLPETADIPVIVFSGQKSETIVDEALRLGARAYVQKSFTNTRLADVIEITLTDHSGPTPGAMLKLAPAPPAPPVVKLTKAA